jgi:hypothetical protein
MSAFTRIADFVQKGAVLGLFSVFAFQVYQIGFQFSGGTLEPGKNQHEEILKKIAKKVEEESQPHSIDKIPDRYDAEDDSYLKKVPKLN